MTLDQGIGGLPTTPPPASQFAKTPGGGIASPTYVDPSTGEYIDPFTGKGTGVNTTGDPVQNSYQGDPVRTFDWQNTPPPDGFHWENGVLVPNAVVDPGAGGNALTPVGGDAGAGGDGSGGGSGVDTVPIGTLPRITPPPPPDASGYTPQSRGGSGRGGNGQGGDNGQGGFDQSFASVIPRVAGNDASHPGDMTGMRADVPTWARGLMRSPYARATARGGQGSFSQIGGFQPDADPTDPAEEARQRQMAMLAMGLPTI